MLLTSALIGLTYRELYLRVAGERQELWRIAKDHGAEVPRLSPRLRFWLWQTVIVAAVLLNHVTK